ncbi:MAG: YlbF family regulator [Eubacteriales bacterium]|nr:YlbF family regulator [Eubacteriales bacterium]MDD4105454.1 YlbF family regulator [Eubacteriales bacterium]MDD4710569.1 YlbF family regulator [Eubacteriales bacterium]NLO15037.1 YlbF family regulator [Clostridiales bacterium]
MKNDIIYEKARELGQLLKDSKTFSDMRTAEDKANDNPVLVGYSGEYEQLRFRVQQMTLEDAPDYESIGGLNKQMEELQDKMMQQGDMKALQNARSEFTALMNEVNKELQGVLSPESLESGCAGGSCSSCSGCGAR